MGAPFSSLGIRLITDLLALQRAGIRAAAGDASHMESVQNTVEQIIDSDAEKPTSPGTG
jgi:hypothetical protein